MYLLDSHIFLWLEIDDPKLPTSLKEIIISTNDDIFVSIITFWEIAIKNSIGKLELPSSISQLMADCAEMGFSILPIKDAHLDRLKNLPRIHGDPFDRLLICQAQVEKLILMTADNNIPKYAVQTLWS